jgi:hypothetical protein
MRFARRGQPFYGWLHSRIESLARCNRLTSTGFSHFETLWLKPGEKDAKAPFVKTA